MIIDFNKGNGGGTLPIATEQQLGGIKVGSGLSITTAGTLSADAQPVGVATTASTGIVQVGSGLSITSGGVLSTDIDLSNYATQDELSGYVETSAMSGYVETNALSGYVETSAMSGYQTTDAMSGYVETSAMSGYVETSDLENYTEKDEDGNSEANGIVTTSDYDRNILHVDLTPPYFEVQHRDRVEDEWETVSDNDIALVDIDNWDNPTIALNADVAKFGYMNEDEDVAHFLVVHGDGLFDEWYDKTEDPETGDITWNSRGLVPIGGGGGDADKALELAINDDYSLYMHDSVATGVNCVFTDKNGVFLGNNDSCDFQQDVIVLKYNAYGYFAVNFHLESIGEESYQTDITFEHQDDNKLVYTDPNLRSAVSVEMEYGDDNIFFEDSQVALHVYYQNGIIEFYKSSVSRAPLPEVVATIQITDGYTTEYVGQDTYGVVENNSDERSFYPVDYKFVEIEDADHVNHVITASVNETFELKDNNGSVFHINIMPSSKSIAVYINDGSGDAIYKQMPCYIDLSEYVSDVAIKASIYEGRYNGMEYEDNTAQVVVISNDNYSMGKASPEYQTTDAVPSKFFELIREAKTRFYSVINTDNGAFVYEGKDNLTVKNGIEVVDQLPFIGVENKIYMLENEYQSVSYTPSVCIDSDGNWLEINQVHDLDELPEGRIEFDDEGMCCTVGDNGIRFAIGDMYQDNQALAVVRIYGDAPEYKVKTFPAFMVSLANDPDNNNEPCYKVAWNFNFLGTDYDNELYLPISGNTTEYVSGEDFDLSGITEDTVTIGTVNGEGGYFDLAIEGTEMYVTNGEYVCKDDFAEVGANEMSLYKYKGGRYYQVNGGDDIVAGTGVVVEESVSPY